MSSISKGRIKQIRPRQQGSFPLSGIPIGTDGLLVDMISQLDLEEELRLGGNHYVDVDQKEDSTIIKEWYFSQSLQESIIPSEENTNIDEITTYSCQISLSEDDIIIENSLQNTITTIVIELYKGNFKKKIHKKVIEIYEFQNGQVTVNQSLDSFGN